MNRYDKWIKGELKKAIEPYRDEGFRMKINGLSFHEEMEELRKQMVESAGNLGMSHPVVLKYSQQLDKMYTLSMRQRYFHYSGQK